MILPTQLAAGAASSMLMRSMIEDSEERRIQEEEARRKTPKTDDLTAAKLKRSQSHAALNEKINAHFFGALGNDSPLMARLISRFLDAIGVSVDPDATRKDIADCASDALVLMEKVSKDAKKLKLPITLESFKTSVEAVEAARDPARAEEAHDPVAAMIARTMDHLSIAPRFADETKEEFSYRVGLQLRDYRATLANSVQEVERRSGLRDLGFSANQLIEAIANPGGDMAKAIQDALDTQARKEKFASKDMAKVLQRLEEAADPKTLDELKLDRTDRSDPTKVEDAETKKEREEKIRSLEAAGKLDDVLEAQDAIAEMNKALDTLPEGAKDGAGTSAASADVSVGDVLLALAAGAEAAHDEVEREQTEATQGESAVEAAEAEFDESAGKSDETKQAEAEEKQTQMIARAAPGDPGTAGMEEEEPGILPVSMDENGIYAILKRKAEEAAQKAPLAAPAAA